MEEILINSSDFNTICRLCLSKGVTFDIFAFSTRFRAHVTDVIVKCAPVQIARCDGMPNFICQSCYTQLEKSHQFQKKIVESDKTLRRCLQQLRTSNKQIKAECSIQGHSEDPLIHNTNRETTIKCNSSEFQELSDINVNLNEEMPSNYISRYPINEVIICPKFEIKEESINDKSSVSTECTDNEIESISKGDYSKIRCDIKEEPIDDDSLIPTKCADNVEDTTSEGDFVIQQQPNSFIRLPSAGSTEYFDNCEGENKNSSKNRKKHEKSNILKHKCDMCIKSFRHLSFLNYHRRTHTGEKPYQCEICKKCFSYSSGLATHQRIHTGEKPYQCDVCKKSFYKSDYLRTHQRVHTGEKPYQCDVCNKCFSESSTLRYHKRLHTGEKPYQCDICNKSFSVLYYLKRHQRVHSGEKPYQCDVCGKCFSDSTPLRIHKRVHTGEKPYQCDVCNKYFSQLCALNTHKRKHSSDV